MREESYGIIRPIPVHEIRILAILLIVQSLFLYVFMVARQGSTRAGMRASLRRGGLRARVLHDSYNQPDVLV